ncbi:hypothetical protein VTI74DRAFT_3989 [Chaetomium olivicolor]
MADPDANYAGADPDLDTRFSHLTMPAQGDGQIPDTASSWAIQDTSIASQLFTTGFDPAQTPSLTTTLASQGNVSHDYQQYYHGITTGPVYPPQYNSTTHAGPSSEPTDPEEPFACTEDGCSNRYRRQCDLDKHMNNHIKPRHCKLCPFRGAENKDLNRHMWSNHPDVARKWGVPREEEQCPVCGHRARKDNMKRHRKMKGH